ncbi:MAG: tetratricopeptide repeat protein, partial [Candidatus Marinimicrobia bacterium]|nr:tetratricopeptide repeat protein [Candidatus Neomarinimicrobiota bacterium]
MTISSSSAQGVSNNERNDYLIALGLFEDGLYQSTELRLQDFLYKYPSSEWRESAYYLLGKSQFYLKKYPEVRNILKEFMVQFPFSTLVDDAVFLVGESYYEENNFVQAAEQFAKIADDFPKSELLNKANYWAGESYFEIPDYKKAAYYYSQVINSNEDDLKDYAYYSIGWSNLLNKNYPKAISAFQSLINSFPESELISDAKFKIGECYWRNKDYQSTIEILSSIDML